MNPTHTTAASAVSQLLRNAADYIEQRGWNKGSYYSNPTLQHPAACVDGALRIAKYGEPITVVDDIDPQFNDYNAAHAWFNHYLYTHVASHQGEPTGMQAWNDSPGTTGADVVDTLRAAANAWDTHTGGSSRLESAAELEEPAR